MAVGASWKAYVAARPQLQRSMKILAWVPVAVFITQHVGSVVVIEGRSMQPTFNPDTSHLHEDVVFVNRVAKSFNWYKVGDIVTFWAPGLNRPVLVTKRIVALEGDIVRTLGPWKANTVRIPKGHAWVEGDEPIRSRDSNTFGPLPLGLVDGRVDAIIWPYWRSRFIENSVPPHAQKRIMHHRANAG